MRRKRSLMILLLTSFILFSFGSGVNAQAEVQDKGITISPVKFEYDVNPGETVTGTIKLINSTFSDKTIYLYTNNFISDGSSGAPIFVNEERPFEASLEDWIKLDSDQVLVKQVEADNPHVEQLKFTITVPVNAEPGGHYAGVIASLVEPDDLSGLEPGTIAFKDERAAIIILNVKGDVSRQISVDKFYATDAFSKEKPMQQIFEWMPVGFITELRNTGNSHSVPVGNILIMSGDSKVDQLDFNADQGNVLRESSRSFFDTWSGALFELTPIIDENGNEVLDQNGNIQTRFAFNFQNLRLPLGRFTAKLTAGYDDDGQKTPLVQEFEFWVFPWKLVLIILLIVAAVIYYKIRSRKRK